MNVNKIKSDPFWRFNEEKFYKSIEFNCLAGIRKFKKIIRSYVFFHLFFIGLLTAEVMAFFLFLTALFQISLIAFSLATILLTAFAYLILLLYFQTKKPEQFLQLRNFFMLLCKKGLPKNIMSSEYHLSLASAAHRFASHLNLSEVAIYPLTQKMSSLNQFMRKINHLCHKSDIKKMKEVLYLVSISEHIQLIKNAPTNLEAHASLANAYVALSHLYQAQGEGKEKFKNATQKAIQEFKIIDHYSPKNPWVHAQLASCYHDLRMHNEEIIEYEAILKLCPEDKQILFRLGALCFKQGKNARGLQIYEQLKAIQFNRADELIEFYDANIKQEYFISSL